GLVGEAHALHDAGTEVVDDDIGAGDEAAHGLLVGVAAHIGLEAPLVAVERGEDRVVEAVGVAADGPARKRAGLRPLDLDDVGAVVAEHLRAAGAEHHLRKVDDADAVKGKGRLAHAAISSTRALAAGWSPGSAPAARRRFCTSAILTLRTVVP